MKIISAWKFILIGSLFLLSGKTSALTCMQLAKIADDNADTPRTKYSFVVKGGKGFRTYFHSAPSHECKIDGLLAPKVETKLCSSFLCFWYSSMSF